MYVTQRSSHALGGKHVLAHRNIAACSNRTCSRTCQLSASEKNNYTLQRLV